MHKKVTKSELEVMIERCATYLNNNPLKHTDLVYSAETDATARQIIDENILDAHSAVVSLLNDADDKGIISKALFSKKSGWIGDNIKILTNEWDGVRKIVPENEESLGNPKVNCENLQTYFNNAVQHIRSYANAMLFQKYNKPLFGSKNKYNELLNNPYGQQKDPNIDEENMWRHAEVV